ESPTVPSRASQKQSGGGFGGFRGKKKRAITFAKVILFVHTRKPQGAGCACDRKQSLLSAQ
ncbi:MAG: hypothetical protein ABUK15_06670, partial [Anaerolineales bacterium]